MPTPDGRGFPAPTFGPALAGVSVSGLFLALEGAEGSGKSTQAELLTTWMRQRGLEVVAVREPGGTAVGEAIRTHVWVRTDLEIDPVSELMLVSAARSALVAQVIRPALERGAVVVADRFALSTLAYQGFGRGLALDTIREVTAVATAGLAPELYLVLEVPHAVGARRQREAGMAADRMEIQGSAFLDRVEAGYNELSRSEPGIAVVDGTGSVESVQQRLRDVLGARFPDRFGRRDP